MRKEDTIGAVGTPAGEGGVAIIRISGPQARSIGTRLFRPAMRGAPDSWPGYTVGYGAFVDDATGEVLDEGLLTLFRTPRSYTGEDTVEMACHGGRATTTRILQSALAAGARLAEPGEFTQRAFFNGRMDLAQAEAVADLVRARTETARRMARRQLEGDLSRKVSALQDDLIGILAAIEVTIDFSDEVGELEYAPLRARLASVRGEMERLLATAERGRILREGIRVAIIGSPNVGKSSLLNALLRAERAIVTPIAGTTRDLVEETANLRGLPVVLVDTAGIRETEDPVERIGVARAESAASTADLLIFVVDGHVGVTPEDRLVANRLSKAEKERTLFAVNKSDLANSAQREEATVQSQAMIPDRAVVAVSALTGMGLDVLEATLSQAALGTEGEAASVVVSSARHRQALEEALSHLIEAERTAELEMPGDFVVIDVRGALDAIGRITGATVTEDIIHRIFHDFCVGK